MSLAAILYPLKEAAGAVPRQQQLGRLLKEAILDGRLAGGVLLPASRQLATDLGIARNTVLHAYQQLLAEGFLHADRRGTRVADLPTLPGRALALPPSEKVSVGLSRRAGGLPARHDEPLLPFAPGVADLNAFPWASWARHLQKAWGEVSARQLAYAEPGGEPRLRQAVAHDLRARRGVSCSPEQVFIVAGAQVALDACARLLADEGDTVWLESPGYLPARAVMLAAGLKPVHVPVDTFGMAPDAGLWQSNPPRLVYLTPSHQYPLGAVLGLERRLEFLQRMTAMQGWIIEDDYDSEFNHALPGYRPLPSMQGLHPEAPVVYVGTFSKLLYPGLRIAYMVVPQRVARAFGDCIESLYRSGQAVEQRALASFIESGALTRHLRRMAPIYRARQMLLRQELLAGFGAEIEILGGDAGLHLAVAWPGEPQDVQVVARAAQLGVTARALSNYYVPEMAGIARNGLLLGYGMAEEKRIPELVGRLVQAYRGCLEAGSSCDLNRAMAHPEALP